VTAPVRKRWRDLPAHRRADGINIKWIGCDDPLTGEPGRVWDIGGWNEGAQGAFISGPVKGMVHRPFRAVRHSPAYGPPRFERVVDELREIEFQITLVADSEYGWFDTETFWWNGMRGDRPGWFCVWTRRFGEFYIPAHLGDSIEDELVEDPTNLGNYSQDWRIRLAVDGDTNWRTPDLRPKEWVVRATDPVVSVKRDDNMFAPMINVRKGSLKVRNGGTEPAWPIYTVGAPGRVWLPDGVSGRMIRVPRLFEGETCLIDTNPEHRIAISTKDPMDNWLVNVLSNVDLLEWLGITEFQERTESVLERFHGQGFSQPIAPGTVATLPIYHSQVGARVSVRLPQRYERAIS